VASHEAKPKIFHFSFVIFYPFSRSEERNAGRGVKMENEKCQMIYGKSLFLLICWPHARARAVLAVGPSET
jgi:hypothetical protein